METPVQFVGIQTSLSTIRCVSISVTFNTHTPRSYTAYSVVFLECRGFYSNLLGEVGPVLFCPVLLENIYSIIKVVAN